MVLLLLLLCLGRNAVDGFVTGYIRIRTGVVKGRHAGIARFWLQSQDTNEDEMYAEGDDWKQPIGDGILDCDAEGGEVIADLSWRVAKLRLEEQNTARFLKARPRFLPYDDCRKWVQAWSRWKTEEDWRSWISMGEKRNSYIPSKPDVYYQETGDWRGWNHFLGIEDDENNFQ